MIYGKRIWQGRSNSLFEKSNKLKIKTISFPTELNNVEQCAKRTRYHTRGS